MAIAMAIAITITIAIAIAIAIRNFKLTVHGPIRSCGPQAPPGSRWRGFLLDGFDIDIAIPIEIRIAFGF